jgi:hypothetical protein
VEQARNEYYQNAKQVERRMPTGPTGLIHRGDVAFALPAFDVTVAPDDAKPAPDAAWRTNSQHKRDRGDRGLHSLTARFLALSLI